MRFAANVQGLLDGSVVLDGLEIDNNLRWSIITALSSVNLIDDDVIATELAKRETTENRQFAYGARASRSTAEAKAWAFDQALNNADLTNSQMEAVAIGFSDANAELATPYVARYFDSVDWIWEHKTFHMAETLIGALYPRYADPKQLTEIGDRWLSTHADADDALRHMISENVEGSHRTLAVRDYNASL